MEAEHRYLRVSDDGETRLVWVPAARGDELSEAGCRREPMSWSEVREFDRGDYREIENALESPADQRFAIVHLEPKGSYISVYHPRSGSYMQWLDHEQTQALRDRGVEFDEAGWAEGTYYAGLADVHRGRSPDRPFTELIEALQRYRRSV